MAEPLGSSSAGYSLPRDTLVVRGPDRKTWLDGLVTCLVTGVSPGAAAYGLLLTKQGKIVSDVFLADDGSQLFIGLPPGQGAVVRELLDRYLVMEDAELTVPEPAPAWQLLTGSSDETEALQQRHEDDAQQQRHEDDALQQRVWGWGPKRPETEALARGALTLGGLKCSLAVTAVLGEGVAQPRELSALLAEHGLGSFGVDFDQRDNPHEASLDRVAVSWSKGCYLGQEVVCMQDMRGKVKRRLVPLAGGGELLSQVSDGGQITEVLGPDGVSVGHVTSVHAAPSGETRLLASLASSALESQSALTVLGRAVRVVEAVGPLLS